MPRQGNRVTHIIVEKISEFNFAELCVVCDVAPDFLVELIAYGVIEPRGTTQDSWRFDPEHLHVIRMAAHLHQDLEVNHAGIALAIDLMNKLDQLRGQIEILEKHVALGLRRSS